MRNTAEMRGEVTVLREAIAPVLRDRMRGRMRALIAATQGSSGDDRRRIGIAIAALLDCFPSLRKADARDVTAKFVLEVADMPAWAVEKACAQMRRGEVADVSADFPPSTIRLRQVVTGLIAPSLEEALDIRRLLEAEVEYQPTEEERARVSLGFKKLNETLKARQAEQEPPPKRQWSAPSDDDLRRLYPKREQAAPREAAE